MRQLSDGVALEVRSHGVSHIAGVGHARARRVQAEGTCRRVVHPETRDGATMAGVDITCVTIDSRSPETVAAFWNEALRWGGTAGSVACVFR